MDSMTAPQNQLEERPEETSEERREEAGPRFTLTRDVLIRRASGAMLVVVVLASAAMSWEGLTHLGTLSGMGWTGILLPLSIDGALLLGSLESLHAVLGNRRSSFGKILTSVGVSLSIAGNMVSAADHGLLASSTHAIPPLMLFLSLAAFERVMKHRIVVQQAEQKAEMRKIKAKAAPKAQSATPKRGQERVGKPETVPVESLRSAIDGMGANASKASMIEAMLLDYPEAKTAALAEALGVDSKQVATTISRVRKRLAEKPMLTAVS